MPKQHVSGKMLAESLPLPEHNQNANQLIDNVDTVDAGAGDEEYDQEEDVGEEEEI